MEKLKVKHDHTLTDIIKVAIFALFLILPVLVFLPNCLYYGFNEHAVVNTEEKQVYEYKNIDFNQKLGEPVDSSFYTWHDTYITFDDSGYTGQVVFAYNLVGNDNHIVYIKLGRSDTFTSPGSTYQFYWQSANSSYYGVAYSSDYYYGVYSNPTGNLQLRVYDSDIVGKSLSFQFFDLTQMFGSGNEPTKQQFDSMFTNNYYEQTLTKVETIKIDTGETKNYTDIASNITNAWQDTWDTPMLQWTNTNTFKFTINAFVNVFGITQESKMANYLTYILVVTCIYLVFDIVLTLTTKLTHLINEK